MPLPPITDELIEANYAAGFWQPRALYEVVDETARVRPDALAVADQHERISYAELVGRSHALAQFLLGLGLQSGAAVALQTPNRTALAITHLACDRADLLYVPLSNSWRQTELSHLLAVSEAEVVIVPQAHKGVDFVATVTGLRSQLPKLKHLGTLDGKAAGADFDFAEASLPGSATVARQRDPNAARYAMVTSGTTELPRISLWSDNNLWCFMQMFIGAVQLGPEDIAVGLSPANTGAVGYVFPVLGPLLAGASSILLENWSPEAAMTLLERERATTATAVPTQVLKMLQHKKVGDFDYSSLRVFTNAGSALPPHAAQKMETVFGCVNHILYGTTDGGVPTSTTVTDPPEKRQATVGRILAGNELRLVDTCGQVVAPGQSGEIRWRSPTKSYGYLNDSARTEQAFDDEGFYHSGDLGRIDDEGYVSIVGRVKDLIIRGGQNISPQELENLLSRHPAVAEVSVIGVPDPVYGERVCACVVLRSGQFISLEDMVDFLRREKVATFKLPERLEVFEDMPKSAGGKIRKVELRATVEQRGERPVDDVHRQCSARRRGSADRPGATGLRRRDVRG